MNEKTTKAAPKKSTKKAEQNGKAPQVLTKPQVRILSTLAKAKGPLNRADVARRASVAASWVTGFTDHACKANTTPALAEQGLARVIKDDELGICYEITAGGRKTLARVLAAK